MGINKAWFPYDRPDRPDRPSRLKIGPSDRDDHMETQQRRLRARLYDLGYPRQPFPRVTLAVLTFHLFL